MSVVIPTHNRRHSVLRTIAALLAQEDASCELEIVVSCDRCEDGTPEAVRETFGSRVRVVEPPSPGLPATRNFGLRSASGELVIFLDDDMEPETGFVAAHVSAHESSEGPAAVSGSCPPIVPSVSTPIQRALARYYEGFFRGLERPDRTPEPGDLVGGNFSISAARLEEVGGFDESFRLRDDFELGARLLARGFALSFCRAARARMHILPTGAAMVRGAEARGRNDVRLARHLPEFRHNLPFHRIFARPFTRLRWRLLWSTSGAAVVVLSALRRFAPENMRLINFEYAARYIVGLRHEAGDWKTFSRLARGGGA